MVELLGLLTKWLLLGIVGEHKGSVAREILISLEDWDEMQQLEADEDTDLTKIIIPRFD